MKTEETREVQSGLAMRQACSFLPPMVYRFSGRNVSGAVVLSEVVGWKSDWASRLECRHSVFTRTGITFNLDDDQIKEFEREYEKWMETANIAVVV